MEEKEMMILGGDLNGHVGEDIDGFEGVHGGKDFGNRNEEGEMILEFALAHNLMVMNTCFEKEVAKKVTYELHGKCKTVMDYISIDNTARQKLGAGCEGDKKQAMHTTAQADGVQILPKRERKGKENNFC